jgi:3-hydroxyisobutyrate dehydrogenase-like beta-hydroxyacid dehydrogenase
MSQPGTIGVVGLGLLGAALAHRLLQAGYAVVGFDLEPAKTAALATHGGEPMPSLSALASNCEIAVLAVFSTDQVEAVVENELLPAWGDRTGRIVLCASTCDPDRLAELALRCAARGLALLETPVSGSSSQVGRGEGVGLLGGDGEMINRCEPILRALFSRYFHVGKVGDGGRAKLAVNLILGLNRLALAEGLVFAERLGLNLDAFLKIARACACYSQVMDIKGTKMLHADFTAAGRVSQHLKDVHLMLEQAQRTKQLLPLLEAHADVLEACVRHGEGELDNSAVIEEIRRRRRA